MANENAVVQAKGKCSWGYADEVFETELGLPLAGHAMTGNYGNKRDGQCPLHMRTLILNPKEDNEIVICFMDLLTGSIALLDEVRRLMSPSHDRIALVGSHTHYGPGSYFGNSFYDSFAQPPPKDSTALLGEVSKPMVEFLAGKIHLTIGRARESAQVGRVAVIQSKYWKSGACNRSYGAFKANGSFFDKWNSSDSPAAFPPNDIDELQKAIDPRVTTILTVNEAKNHICAFSTAACHTTCMGIYKEEYSADWPGIAVQTVAAAKPLGDEIMGQPIRYDSAFAVCAAGDVTPMSPNGVRAGGGEDQGQGHELKVKIGENIGGHVAKTITEAFSEVMQDSDHPIEISFKTTDWNPSGPESEGGHNLGPPYPGYPLLAGTEDGWGK